jgi:glycosyltransferase involved in cell wall biosynthesis
MPEPIVSVVIPAWNVERYIGEAIDSVLAQQHRPLEVIVVDDDSSDGTSAVLEGYADPVRYAYQEHAGASAARNRGARLARGDLLAFLDGDDLWEPEKLSLQLRALASPARPDIVFGHVREFISPDLAGAERDRLRCDGVLRPGIVPGSMMVRRQAFDGVGGFDETLKVGEALDWLGRARACGLRETMLAEHVLSRRLHGANYMRGRADLVGEYPSLLKAALDRRRARGLA